MSEIQKSETGIAKRIDLDQFKSLYYLLNAKPDSQLRLLKEDKEIDFNDLVELNEKVVSKLKTESLETSITTITIVFKSKKVSTYNNWLEFSRTNWNIADQTLSISINWDINVKLPEHELPQRHTLKVRLGSAVRPSEMFQLMMTSDKDDELMEATSNGVCKVDFINHVIANELLAIVEDWYQTLPNNISENKFIQFSQKYRRYIAFSIKAIIPVSAIFISYNLISRKILSIADWTNGAVKDLLFMVCGAVAFIYISDIIATVLSTRVFNQLGDYKDYSMFQLTKADKNSIDVIDKKNNRIKTSVITQLVISLIVGLISLFLGKLIDKI
jgi:DNA repair protein RadC